MSDAELRLLERRVAEGDESARPALERAWLRSRARIRSGYMLRVYSRHTYMHDERGFRVGLCCHAIRI